RVSLFLIRGVVRLRRRRVGRVCGWSGGRLRIGLRRLDRRLGRLVAALGRRCDLVRARPFHVFLLARAAARCRPAATSSAAALSATTLPTAPLPARTYRTEAPAVALAGAAALARGAEPLDVRAAPAPLVPLARP